MTELTHIFTVYNKLALFRSIFLSEKLQKYLPALEDMAKGMECYDILSIVRENNMLFESVFCPSQEFSWNYESVIEKISVEYAIDGTNKKTKEISTYKAVIDFLQTTFYNSN